MAVRVGGFPRLNRPAPRPIADPSVVTEAAPAPSVQVDDVDVEFDEEGRRILTAPLAPPPRPQPTILHRAPVPRPPKPPVTKARVPDSVPRPAGPPPRIPKPAAPVSTADQTPPRPAIPRPTFPRPPMSAPRTTVSAPARPSVTRPTPPKPTRPVVKTLTPDDIPFD